MFTDSHTIYSVLILNTSSTWWFSFIQNLISSIFFSTMCVPHPHSCGHLLPDGLLVKKSIILMPFFPLSGGWHPKSAVLRFMLLLDHPTLQNLTATGLCSGIRCSFLLSNLQRNDLNPDFLKKTCVFYSHLVSPPSECEGDGIPSYGSRDSILKAGEKKGWKRRKRTSKWVQTNGRMHACQWVNAHSAAGSHGLRLLRVCGEVMH